MPDIALQLLNNLNPLTNPNLKVREVWLDADGCFVDWEGYIAKRIHLLSNIFSVTDYRANIPILNGMDKGEREKLIRAYYHHFPDTFLNLDITTSFHYFVCIARWLQKHGIPVKILTSLDNKHHNLEVATHHKHLNISKHLHQHRISLPIEVVQTHSDKTAYAKEGSLLIDDYHRNVTTFIEHGGMGILHKKPENTIRELYDIMSK